MLFQHTDNLSRALQSAELAAVDGTSMAQSVVAFIRSFRTEAQFDIFYDNVRASAKDLGTCTGLISFKVICLLLRIFCMFMDLRCIINIL